MEETEHMNGNKPAYPARIHESERLDEYRLLGLTKREVFAMAAMQGLIATGIGTPEDINNRAVVFADDLLKQLEQ